MQYIKHGNGGEQRQGDPRVAKGQTPQSVAYAAEREQGRQEPGCGVTPLIPAHKKQEF